MNDCFELGLLPKILIKKWEQIFLTRGYIPYQDPKIIYALQQNSEKSINIIVNQDKNNLILCAFQKDREENIATNLFQGNLFLTDKKIYSFDRLFNLFDYTCTVLGVKGLYFPLVYEDDFSSELFFATDDATIWWRRDCPIILWNEAGNDLWPRCIKRLGTRAQRRKRAFEQARLKISWADAEQTISAISQIEKKSWKAQAKQDIFSRDQFEFYSNIIKKGIINARVVWDGTTPVAYRLDYSNIKNRVYCMKWSYAETYSRYSPGFYLIAKDLKNSWGNEKIDFIDLYGSPDHLKASVQNGKRQRYDLGWRGEEKIQRIRNERLTFDARLENNYQDGKGIRFMY